MSNDHPDPQGLALEGFREYLALLARLLLGPRLRGKVDLSGVVQETLLEAHRAMAELDRMPEPQRLGWLRRALANNIADEARRLGTAMRDVGREVPLADALDQSSARLEGWLAADQLSPPDRAARNEQVLRLAAALAWLPDDQRAAVELRHLHGLPVAEVARVLGRTDGAVGALLVRGLRRLRALMGPPDPG